MGQSASRCVEPMGQPVSRCAELLGGRVTKREADLERQCAELALRNEELRLKLKVEQQSAKAMTEGRPSSREGSLHGGSIFAPPGSTPRRGSTGGHPALSREGSQMDLAGLASATHLSITAAADAAAEAQSSLVRVTIDNERHADMTEVHVRAPNRARLLADLASALVGLSMVVVGARVSTTKGRSEHHFLLQEGGGAGSQAKRGKVLEPDRLRAIEQRLQQRFRGHQGINGGVRRLVVDRFVR